MVEEVIELTKKLVSIPSPSGREKAILDYIANYLGFCRDLKLQEVEKDRNNIIASNIMDEKKPTVIINGHVDTVEPMAGWHGNEYRPRVQDNRLYGLGSADQKAGVAVALSVFKEFYQKTGVNTVLLLCIDEESISKGAFRSMEKLRKADLCLVTEPSQEDIGIAARGRIVVQLDVHGKSAHGARPHLGINAIDESAKTIREIAGLHLRKDWFMGSGSLCALKIESGTESLSVPEYCRIQFDRHIVTGETKESVLFEFREAVKRAKSRAKVDVSIAKRETPYLQPFITDVQKPLVSKFIASYQKFYKKKPEMYCNASVGDYNVFGQRMPTIIYGPRGENWHAANEFVYTDSILRCRQLYVEFLKGFK